MIDEPLRRPPQRRLTEAERVLWREITRGIAPLRPEPRRHSARTETGNDPQPAAAKVKPQHPSPAHRVEPAASAPPPLAPLGRRMRQRIARGNHAIGGRLDLHGLSQAEAHDRLIGFLRTAQSRGESLVLVITGKGAPAAESGGRGVLRRQVPHWLRLPDFRDLIVGFETAHIAHGGDGALYVRLRRRRA